MRGAGHRQPTYCKTRPFLPTLPFPPPRPSHQAVLLVRMFCMTLLNFMLSAGRPACLPNARVCLPGLPAFCVSPSFARSSFFHTQPSLLLLKKIKKCSPSRLSFFFLCRSPDLRASLLPAACSAGRPTHKNDRLALRYWIFWSRTSRISSTWRNGFE